MITKNTDIEAFKAAWTSGMENLLKACKIYVEAINKDAEAKHAFREAFPKLSDSAWSRIEATGRGQMHFALLCDTSPASAKLRSLPYSEQKEAIESGIEVLTAKGDVLKVKHENLTQELVRQAIAKDHIRSIPAQKAYVESKKIVLKAEASQPKDFWRIKGNQLHVLAPTSFTRQQLINILQDIG